jgi:hypothetical protein
MGGAVLVWGDGDGDVSGEQESVGVLRGRVADRAVEQGRAVEVEAEQKQKNGVKTRMDSTGPPSSSRRRRLLSDYRSQPGSFDTGVLMGSSSAAAAVLTTFLQRAHAAAASEAAPKSQGRPAAREVERAPVGRVSLIHVAPVALLAASIVFRLPRSSCVVQAKRPFPPPRSRYPR